MVLISGFEALQVGQAGLTQCFGYAASQIAPVPPVVALHRKSQLEMLLRFGTHSSKIALAAFTLCPKSRRLQDASATKLQTLALYKIATF